MALVGAECGISLNEDIAGISLLRQGHARIGRVVQQRRGAHTDHINARGSGSYAYRVCEAGTSTCSSIVTVTF